MFIIEFSNPNITNWVVKNMGPLAVETLKFTSPDSQRTADINFIDLVLDLQLELLNLQPPAENEIDPTPRPDNPYYPDTVFDAAMFASSNLQFQIKDRDGNLLHDCSPFGIQSFEVMPLATLNNYPLDKLFRYHLRAQTFSSSILRKVQAHLSDSLLSSLDTLSVAQNFISGWLNNSLVSVMADDPSEVYRLFEVLKSLSHLHSLFSQDFTDFSSDHDPYDLEFC